MTDVTKELTDMLLEHMSFLSFTGEEKELTDSLESRYRDRGEKVIRVGDSLVVGDPDDPRPQVALVGHLDIVPLADEDDGRPRIEERDGAPAVVGRGSSDMKSGNVIGMHVFEDQQLRKTSPYNMILVLYAREEGPMAENELADVFEQVDWLRDVKLGLVLEPTAGNVELGCQGVLNAQVIFRGTASHSARPWLGDNAVPKAAGLLTELAEPKRKDVIIDGLTYRDAISITEALTFNARNVVPDTFSVNVNMRFAPSRETAQAEEELTAMLRAWAPEADDIIVSDRANGAPPRATDDLVAKFAAAAPGETLPKHGWTDVSRFSALGIPALNYGPGHWEQAHRLGEWAPVAAITQGYETVRNFLST